MSFQRGILWILSKPMRAMSASGGVSVGMFRKNRATTAVPASGVFFDPSPSNPQKPGADQTDETDALPFTRAAAADSRRPLLMAPSRRKPDMRPQKAPAPAL